MIPGFTRRWRARAAWPRPRGTRYSACHFCDTLHEVKPIAEGDAARCTRCGAVLYQNRRASLTRAAAFSMAAMLAMVLMHSFPFLVMDAASLRRSLTLFGAALSLSQEGMPELGAAVILFTVIAPFVLAGGMLYVTLPLLFGRAMPHARWVAKWMYFSEPWNMAEVFLLGVLVSLLKIAKLADVEFGIGFWACGMVMVCMAAAVAGIDREELWDRLEVAES